KLENYNENLNSAISLWNKILHLSEDIERWSEYRKNVFETPELTRKNILQLNVEAENQEKHLEEISKLSRGIQNLLQINELPLELQVIKTSLQSKITPFSKFAAEKIIFLEKSAGTSVLSPPTTSSTDGEDRSTPPAGDLSQRVNGESEGKDGKYIDETQLSNRRQGSTAATSEPQRIEFQTESQPGLSGVQQSERLMALHVKLSELKKRRESLNADLQAGQREKERQLASFTLLLQEGQDLAAPLEELNAEMMAAGPDGSSQGNQWLETKQLHDSFMQDLQKYTRCR
ncbi:uncharacterized protein, partial [Pyxicephalus adspersus]|uniref:uncharacterized protein n=1 Tax=Pyxicephalus adspersus TaxID=30357 RepID=UPI003B5B27B8